MSGPSLLEPGMRPIVSTDDARYTNAALPRMSGLAFVTGDIAEMLKNATYFAYNGLPLSSCKILRRSVPPSPRYL